MLVRWILEQNPEFSEGSFLSDSPLEALSTVQVGRILNGCDCVAMLDHIKPRVGIVVTWLLNECCKGSNVPNTSNILLLICPRSFTLVCRPVISVGSSWVVGFDRLAVKSLRVLLRGHLGPNAGTNLQAISKLRVRSFVFVPGTKTGGFRGSKPPETSVKTADWPFWNLLQAVNRSQWLCPFALLQVGKDAQQPWLKESSQAAYSFKGKSILKG